MSEKGPIKPKLKELMDKNEYALTKVSKDYWDTIYKGVIDYLFKLGLITNKQEVKNAIKDYIRHQGSDGPQPMWGNP